MRLNAWRAIPVSLLDDLVISSMPRRCKYASSRRCKKVKVLASVYLQFIYFSHLKHFYCNIFDDSMHHMTSQLKKSEKNVCSAFFADTVL